MPYQSPSLVPLQARIVLRRCARGFTLIELIMVVVMLGVLAVFAAPRLLNTGDFNAQGFHDETMSLLRYAQKTAIAQRRTVCVEFSKPAPASATLTIASDPAPGACNKSLAGPNRNCPGGPTGLQGCINAPAGLSYSAGPVSLNFDGLGQPVAASLTIQVANGGVPFSKTITIEPATGYVHD